MVALLRADILDMRAISIMRAVYTVGIWINSLEGRGWLRCGLGLAPTGRVLERGCATALWLHLDGKNMTSGFCVVDR